jgi:hypothetical protein
MDGSAGITFQQLAQEWPNWTEDERQDFCSASQWLSDQHDFPEIVRFIMKHGDIDDWSAVALSIASALPKEESFQFLSTALAAAPTGNGANLAQALAHTQHPQAKVILQECFAKVWASPRLWNDDPFMNRMAFEATTSIRNLLALGAAPAEFEDHVRALSKHKCAGNRASCRNFLAKHYAWLSEPAP